ncbi:MAG: hypothetical protein AAFY39_05540 [Pseudomonadota bacterium]
MTRPARAQAAARPDPDSADLKCPSAQPDFEDAQVLGVFETAGDTPRLSYTAGTLPATQDVVASTGPVPPTLVMRFAGKCETARCVHFREGACSLVDRIVEGLDPVTDNLPACAIRRTCRWYTQEGARACHRCPQVVTRMENPDPQMAAIAEGPAV